MNSRRSASVGALPLEKKHFVSRNESTSGISLDVRCACQYFQSDSLLPERINPVDSRPNSQLGFHADTHETHIAANERPTLVGHDQFSVHSFHAAADRLSVRSLGVGASKPTAEVDLSFVEKYPELEETAKKRGLVISSISDATESDYMPGVVGMHRSRQMSVGGRSAGSGFHDFETMSTRSVTSLRRLPSRSPTKGDLFVADIYIPTSVSSYASRHQPASASVSRRTSNADLSHFSSPTHLSTMALAATPSATQANTATNFSRGTTPQPGVQDYRIAKPPISTDYMRPTEIKDNIGYYPTQHETLPQHRSIDVGKYASSSNIEAELLNLPDVISEFQKISSRAASPAPVQETTVEIVEQPTVDIQDDIKLETVRPPSIASDIPHSDIVLKQQTDIDIVRSLPEVDIKSLVQAETDKVMEARVSPKPTPRLHSPTRKSQLSLERTFKVDSLQLPDSNRSSSALKRQHTPEPQETARNTAPIDSQQLKKSNIAAQPHALTITGAISLQDASPEAKSYASRFKAMFSNTNTKTDMSREASPKRQKSPTPNKEKSPSPAPNRLISMFSKNKNSAVEIKTGTNAIHTAKPEAEVQSVQVTETFALKVDEMDQYMSRPNKSASQQNTEDFSIIERGSTDISDAFAPVIIPSANRASFLAGNRTLYSSDMDMSRLTTQRSDSEIRGFSKENSISRMNIPKGALISMPINIGSQQQLPKIVQAQTDYLDGRTQSQDRARQPSSQDELYTLSRMTKTVSFHFDERKSRLSDFESSTFSQQKSEANDFQARAHFSR